ncbi:MAG TPA: GNAT family N-acetyltransferase [Planctomycetota bacterium]|nr:GNAT family N-acetyltransferase [Planctomycetota bacterium]
MNDMLVKLYNLPPVLPYLEQMARVGIEIRRALPPEKHLVLEFVRKHFQQRWADETDVAFMRQPVSCFIALRKDKLLGFADYDATCRAFFGPTGVDEKERGKGIGKALLFAALHGLREQGYGYGIIGSAEVPEFYAKTVGATVIPDSSPGIFRGMLLAPGDKL